MTLDTMTPCWQLSQKIIKLVEDLFVNRNERFLPLHCQFERKGISLTARRPIAGREKPKRSKWHENGNGGNDDPDDGVIS